MKRFPSFANGSSQVEMSRRIAGTVVLRYAAASWMVIPRDCIWCGPKTDSDTTIRTAPWQVHIGEDHTSLGMAQTVTLVVDITFEESADCWKSSRYLEYNATGLPTAS